MKIKTLLSENSNYQAQLMNDINSYLVRLKANDIPQIDTEVLVGELGDMGYSVTPEALVDMLANSNYITNITTDTIDLKIAPNKNGQDAEKDKERISKLAVKTAQKRMK
jgi:hypothetical protein